MRIYLLRLYFDNQTGNLITINYMNGYFKTTPTIANDFKSLIELQDYVQDQVIVKEVAEEDTVTINNIFRATTISINTATKEFEFAFIPIEDPPTIESINSQVVAKIRTNYSVDDEFQMQRLGLQDNTNVEYQAYLTHVNDCIEWGRQQKIDAGLITA